MSNREFVARLEALETLHWQPTPPPLAGQETLSVATISSHTYEGPGHCLTDIYGTICGAHRDEHQLVTEEDLKEQL